MAYYPSGYTGAYGGYDSALRQKYQMFQDITYTGPLPYERSQSTHWHHHPHAPLGGSVSTSVSAKSTTAPAAPKKTDVRVPPAQPRPMTVVSSPQNKPKDASPKVTKPKQKDLFQETPLRYLGYANELTESWLKLMYRSWGKPAADRLNHQADVVATIYSAADALDKGMKTYRNSDYRSQSARIGDALAMALATGLFQLGASVIIPKQIVRVARLGLTELVRQSPHLVQKVHQWVNRALGPTSPLARKLIREKTPELVIPALGSTLIIPAIVHPVDGTIKFFTDGLYKGIRLLVLNPLEWLQKN